MDDAFVSFAHFFAPAQSQPTQAAHLEPQPQPAATLPAVRRFHAALADALAASLDDLLRDLASDVLARELSLAPCDVERIARGLLERYASQEPLALLVHESDVAAVEGLGVAVRSSRDLRRGDCTLVLRYGSIDASLGARLADVL